MSIFLNIVLLCSDLLWLSGFFTLRRLHSEFWQDRVVVSHVSSFLILPSHDRLQLSSHRRVGSVWSAAWTWRCLGGITHDDTIHATASFRRTGHFQAELDWRSTFWFGKHYFSLHKTCFSSSLYGGWNSDLSLRGSSSGAEWHPLLLSYKVTVTTEEWKRFKDLWEEANSTEQQFFLKIPKREDDPTGQHDSGREWGQRGRTGPAWDSQLPVGERQPAGNQGIYDVSSLVMIYCWIRTNRLNRDHAAPKKEKHAFKLCGLKKNTSMTQTDHPFKAASLA